MEPHPELWMGTASDDYMAKPLERSEVKLMLPELHTPLAQLQPRSRTNAFETLRLSVMYRRASLSGLSMINAATGSQQPSQWSHRFGSPHMSDAGSSFGCDSPPLGGSQSTLGRVPT